MKNARIRGFCTLVALLASVSLFFWRFDSPESTLTGSSSPTATGAPPETASPKGNPFDLRSTLSSPLNASPFSTAFVGDAAGSFEGHSHDRARFDTTNDSHAAMVQVLQRIRDEHRYEKLTFGGESVTDHESRLGRATASPQRLLRSLTSLAERRLWLGDTRAAVAHLQTATDLLATSGMSVLPATRAGLSARLGLAWLRLAENENCVDCNNSASCLLPIGPDGVHRLQEGSRAAMRSLTETLTASPHDLTSRWLLNIAAMTVGEYPAGIPEAFRLIPESLESEEAFPRFLNVALDKGVNTVSHSGGSVIDDFDGDGDLDLVVSSWGEGDELQYFRNTGAGFVEASQEANFSGLYGGLNMIQADLDNDGYPDIYLGTGTPAYEGLMPNVMYRNDRGQRFLNVTTAGGFGHLQKGHGISFADIDNDGDQDVFAEMGGAYPGDMAANALFENPEFGNHWLTVQLVGHRSNRSAIGARIIAHSREGDNERTIYDWVGSGGSFGASPLRCEIGLGKATAVEKLEIHWPASGTKQVFAHVPADCFLRIDEGLDTLTELTLSGPQ